MIFMVQKACIMWKNTLIESILSVKDVKLQMKEIFNINSILFVFHERYEYYWIIPSSPIIAI